MKHIAIRLIKLFNILQPALHVWNVSVFGFSSTCRQTPSCSAYTIQQIQAHGTITGLKRGFSRIIRCHHI